MSAHTSFNNSNTAVELIKLCRLEHSSLVYLVETTQPAIEPKSNKPKNRGKITEGGVNVAGFEHERDSQTEAAATHTTYIFVLLVVAFLLGLLVGFVGLSVHTPHALCPLAVDDAVLLFTGQGRQKQRDQMIKKCSILYCKVQGS